MVVFDGNIVDWSLHETQQHVLHSTMKLLTLSPNLFLSAMSNWAQATHTEAVFTLVRSAAFQGTVREEYIFFHSLETIVSEGISKAPCR